MGDRAPVSGSLAKALPRPCGSSGLLPGEKRVKSVDELIRQTTGQVGGSVGESKSRPQFPSSVKWVVFLPALRVAVEAARGRESAGVRGTAYRLGPNLCFSRSFCHDFLSGRCGDRDSLHLGMPV